MEEDAAFQLTVWTHHRPAATRGVVALTVADPS
jgi:hypothetical protein